MDDARVVSVLRDIEGIVDGVQLYRDAFNRSAQPPPDLLAWEWADEHRVLSKIASADAGKWKTDTTPYMREILEYLSASSPVKRVVLRKGAQLAATETGNTWLGYLMDMVGGPILVVMPTVDMAKRWSKQRLAPMLRDTPQLRDKVADSRTRDSGNTILSKELVDGSGLLIATGANSAVGLRSMPAAWLMLDEVDGYPDNIDNEGHPVDITEARQRTFFFGKMFIPSTPRVKYASRVTTEFEASDQAYYYVACEHCDGRQVYDPERLVYAPEEPQHCHQMACEHCGAMMEYGRQTQRLIGGEWWRADEDGVFCRRPVTPGMAAGFQISSLYSPIGWASWGEIAERKEKAQHDESIARTYTNLDLGLPYEEKTEAPDWQKIYERRETYPLGMVPVGAGILTAAADIQRRWAEIAWFAWGPEFEGWMVDHEVIEGDTSSDEFWLKMTRAANRRFEHAEGSRALLPDMFCVDQGYETEAVKKWVKAMRAPNRVRSISGVDAWGTTAVLGKQETDITYSGKKRKRGYAYWRLAVSTIKLELYRRLRREWPDDPVSPFGGPWMHFPQMGEEWFKQLVAEVLQRKSAMTRSKSRLEWHKIRERNEAHDLTVYNLGAAYMCQVDRLTPRKWAALVKRWGSQSEPEISEVIATSSEPVLAGLPKQKVRRIDRRSN